MQEDLHEFKRQLEEGSIQRAYVALISYVLGLRTHFAKGYPDCTVSGLYQGYMDMTYFAIVFNYDAFRFEARLAASIATSSSTTGRS